jgi:hypothetical protein
MKENISVEPGKSCTHSLNETFRSVIRWLLFLRGRQVLRHLGKQLFAARDAMSGADSCVRKGSHNGREPHATSRMTFHRETRHHWYPQTAWEHPSL